jgi:hypothetical protein
LNARWLLADFPSLVLRREPGPDRSGDRRVRPVGAPPLRHSFAVDEKNYVQCRENFAAIGYHVFGHGWTADMRNFFLAFISSAIASPCLAQTILKSEPLLLAPYEAVFVQSAACPSGQVLKVTGAIRGLHRRKACVALAAEQASLDAPTP